MFSFSVGTDCLSIGLNYIKETTMVVSFIYFSSPSGRDEAERRAEGP